MNNKTKLLIAHNYYQLSGGEDTVVANEINLLKENGHEVFLYTRNNSEIKERSIIGKIKLALTSIFSWKTYKEVQQIIKRNHIDVLHVHNTLPLISPSIYYAAFKCKIPVIQTVHNFRLICPNASLWRDGKICEECLQNGLGCAVKHRCYRNSLSQTLISVCILKIHRLLGTYKKLNYICLTEFNKEKLLSLKQIDPQKVFVKPNFVEMPERIIPYEKRKNQFVFAGRLEKIKGIEVLLKAWGLLGKTAPLLIICGTGPMEQWCSDYIHEMQLSMVELRGFVSRETVTSLVSESKALLFPTQWYEGLPMSIIEALSVGTPIVGSDVGNVQMMIKEGCTGLLFDMDDEKELADKVRKIQNVNLVNNCIESYRLKYDKTHNYAILSQIYNELWGIGSEG